jgi:hypothetical protein
MLGSQIHEDTRRNNENNYKQKNMDRKWIRILQIYKATHQYLFYCVNSQQTAICIHGVAVFVFLTKHENAKYNHAVTTSFDCYKCRFLIGVSQNGQEIERPHSEQAVIADASSLKLSNVYKWRTISLLKQISFTPSPQPPREYRNI